MGPADPRAETLIDGGLVTIVRGDSRRLTKYVAPGTAHLAITSPPYNVAKVYSAHDDNLPAADYWALLKAVFGECHQALVEGGRIAVVVPFGTGRKPWIPLAAPVGALLTELGFTPRGMIIWDKGTPAAIAPPGASWSPLTRRCATAPRRSSWRTRGAGICRCRRT